MNISHGSTLSVVASSSLSFVVMSLDLLRYIEQVICQLLAKLFAQSTKSHFDLCASSIHLRLLFKLLTKFIRYL